ncbi:PerC family transcriptional regulator [Cronobacter turicensis]|nr:PerC family transcriptional regulator [Cronobacter turicensis]EMA1789695.1 PerC family transcriptional regulator [Cronobacter turicensis]EMA1799449.1 PerC family transcriptional regulator [Cronobacter turicensis]EMA1847911.1 PerC family transcriptional regulator [Cronobacter turicensis]EMA1857220.1 PerC family transcriptional regulator [Cronobacter turicensis]
MKLQDQVLSTIISQPGIAFAELMKAFEGEAKTNLTTSVSRLHFSGKVTRRFEDGRYVYTAAAEDAPGALCASDKIQMLEAELKRLLSQGYYRRAGEKCLDLMAALKTDQQREHYATRRRQCLALVSSHKERSWYLAGNYVGDEQ